MLTLSIRAPRRPSCATSRVLLLYLSMKGTRPVDDSAELFTGYEKRAPKQLRELLGNAIRSLIPDLKFRSPALPSFARAFVQKKENMELVHLLAYCPEGRGHASAVEDRLSLVDTEISLRTDGQKVGKVYLAPERKVLPFEQKEDYCTVRIPHISGYALIVFEY